MTSGVHFSSPSSNGSSAIMSNSRALARSPLRRRVVEPATAGTRALQRTGERTLTGRPRSDVRAAAWRRSVCGCRALGLNGTNSVPRGTSASMCSGSLIDPRTPVMRTSPPSPAPMRSASAGLTNAADSPASGASEGDLAVDAALSYIVRRHHQPVVVAVALGDGERVERRRSQPGRSRRATPSRLPSSAVRVAPAYAGTVPRWRR